MNSVNLLGRVTRQPELRFAAGTGNAVCRFTLAVDRYVKDADNTADFINCVVFGKRAETLAQTVSKGTKIAVTGSIKTGSYDAQDGTKRYTSDVMVSNYYYCEKKNENSNDSQGTGFDDDMTPVDDGDMPF